MPIGSKVMIAAWYSQWAHCTLQCRRHFFGSQLAVELVWQKHSGFLTAGILVEKQCMLDGFHGNETTLVADSAFGITLGSMKVAYVQGLDQSGMLIANKQCGTTRGQCQSGHHG